MHVFTYISRVIKIYHPRNVHEFYSAEYTIDKATALKYRNKIATFKESTHTRKQAFLTMITTFGIKQNPYSLGLVDAALCMDDLFEKA